MLHFRPYYLYIHPRVIVMSLPSFLTSTSLKNWKLLLVIPCEISAVWTRYLLKRSGFVSRIEEQNMFPKNEGKTCNQQIKQLVVLSAALTEVLSQLTAGRCDKIISTFLSSLRKIKEERFENQLSSPFVPKIFFHHFLFLKESFIIDYHCFLANTQIINFYC